MNLTKYYKLLFFVSGTILLFGIVSLATFGLRLGIDFSGGTIAELKFEKSVDTAKVRSVLTEKGIGHAQLQTSDSNGIIIKAESLERAKYEEISKSLKEKVGNFEEKRYESFGPIIGKELKEKALYQLGLVSLGIVLYIAYAFRRVQKPITPWQFGIAAIIALLHDLLVVLGIFSVFGHYYGVEIDSLFVTAMLTVLGFSIHDTIVVFDRIRENLKIYSSEKIDFIVNHSISQTLVRSLNTSLTVLFVLLALLLFGGESIRNFVLALFIGIITGTYSSIFVASPILVIWHKWRLKRS